MESECRCLIHTRTVNIEIRLRVEKSTMPYENAESSSRMYTCFGKFGGHMVCDSDPMSYSTLSDLGGAPSITSP